MSKQLVECVPNFSEGRDRATIESIARAIRAVPNVSLLDIDSSYDTNRTVYTFIGAPEAVKIAALEAARAARAFIDMRFHHGAHPRIGALDVCPFIPVSGMHMRECVELANEFAKSLALEFNVPVYLYEYSAVIPERKSLADIRAGEYEGLPKKLADPFWKPDFGPAKFDPRWGATVAGAREFLIAYNINLNTKDKKIAREIAFKVREKGKIFKDESGNSISIPGRLKAVRAIGWYIDAYHCAQVSINVLDFKKTPLHAVYETVKEEAEALGFYVTGSELIGLIPLEALRACGQHFRRKMKKSPGIPDEELIELAAQTMGLGAVQPFESKKKVIEWAIRDSSSLVSLDTRSFVSVVSSDIPAPGGGSVAALVGSLSAALAAMSANLTVGKKGYETVSESLSELAIKAQEMQRSLLDLVDEDTAAFNEVLAAMRKSNADEIEMEAQENALENAEKHAAIVPFETATLCFSAMKSCIEAARSGNINSATDAAAGGYLAYASLESAIMNVRINIKSIKDASFVASMKEDCDSLLAEGVVHLNELKSIVSKVLE